MSDRKMFFCEKYKYKYDNMRRCYRSREFVNVCFCFLENINIYNLMSALIQIIMCFRV